MERLGPLVRPEVRPGGALLVIGALQFVLAMAIVQLAFPGYSDVANYVSDLGATGAAGAGGAIITSPLAWVYDLSIRVLAVLGLIGTYLIRTAFPAKTVSRIGLGCLVAAELSAFLIGTFPEQAGAIHGDVSALAFVFSGLALLVLGFAMFRDTRWDGFRAYTFLSGVVTFVAIGLFLGGVGGAGIQGLLERIVIAPILLWAILAGAHLMRMPTFAPHRIRGAEVS